MRSVKKLLKKAMVFTLSAAMLVGTPLTASAAPLNSVYKVVDHWGDKTDESDNSTVTGTVTNTTTSTETGVLKDNETKILGIALDKKHVDVEVGGAEETLTATITTDLGVGEALVNKYGEEKTDEMLAELKKMIKWQVMNPDGKTIDATTREILSVDVVNKAKGDASQIKLHPRKGTEPGKDMIVKASLDGTYYFTADGLKQDLVNNKTEGLEATASVSIKEYTKNLSWSDGEDTTKTYLKKTVDLGELLVRDPETANDTITWTSTNTKVATVSAAGVVTAKKLTSESDVCDIIAISERGAKAVRHIQIEQGTPASKIALFVRDEDGKYIPIKNYEQDLKNNRDQKEILFQTSAKVEVAVDASNQPIIGGSKSDVEAKIDSAVKTKKNVELKGGMDWYLVKSGDSWEAKQCIITDDITVSSNKDKIADAELSNWNGGGGTVLVNSKNVGKAVITVKASSGKSAKLNVTVKATLQDLEIGGIEAGKTLYSGESRTLTAIKTPAESTDGVKWFIDKELKVGSDDKLINNPNAKINNKGVLTISNKIDPAYPTVTICLESSKKYDGKAIVADSITINVKQSSIDSIIVNPENNKEDVVARVWFNERNKQQTSTSTQNISVPLNKAYVATVEAGYGCEGLDLSVLANTLQWSTKSKGKIVQLEGNGKNVKIKAVGAGTDTITVSGVRAVEGTGNKAGTIAKASVIKATFKVTVKQPVETITLDKPSVVLAYQTQKKSGVVSTKSQKVTLKATLGPKGVGKKETIEWHITKPAGNEDGTTDPTTGKGANVKPVTSAKATFTLDKPEVGDVYEVTAKATSGVSTKATIVIVDKTQSVQISESAKLDANSVPVPITTGNKKNQKTIKIGESLQMHTFVNIGATAKAQDAKWTLAGTTGTENEKQFVAENVTYSVNKKGIVSIDKDGKVYGLGKGKVTITAKTPMGKKATLSVTVE